MSAQAAEQQQPELPAPAFSEAAQALVAEITAASDEVRSLKTAKKDFKDALAKLLAAKAAFKQETGTEYVASHCSCCWSKTLTVCRCV